MSKAFDTERKARRFFRRLLTEAHALPMEKFVAKAPAALAAWYAVMGLADTTPPEDLRAFVLAIKRRFEGEAEWAPNEKAPRG